MLRIKQKKDKKRGDEYRREQGSFLWEVEKEFEKFPKLIRISTDNLSAEDVAHKLLKMSFLVYNG